MLMKWRYVMLSLVLFPPHVPAPSDSVKFGRMRHSVLSQLDRAGSAACHGPQAIVGVGQSQPGGKTSEYGGGLEQQATERRNGG